MFERINIFRELLAQDYGRAGKIWSSKRSQQSWDQTLPKFSDRQGDGYGDGGFNILFSFITGNNRQKLKIAMTALLFRSK